MGCFVVSPFFFPGLFFIFFFFNDTATTEIYTLSLHDALPISCRNLGTSQEILDYLFNLLRHFIGPDRSKDDDTKIGRAHV